MRSIRTGSSTPAACTTSTEAEVYTLYYSPGSCSLVIHCLLEELGVPFEAHRVNLK